MLTVRSFGDSVDFIERILSYVLTNGIIQPNVSIKMSFRTNIFTQIPITCQIGVQSWLNGNPNHNSSFNR